MKKILPVFSYIFHPLFISVFAALLYFFFSNRYFIYQDIYLILIQILIVTILIPVSIYYFLLSLGKVNSIMLNDKSQRRIPLAIHALLLLILIKKSITIDSIPELYYYFLGSLISTVVALFLIILGYKASLHMVGMSALTIFAIGISIHSQVRLVEVISLLTLCTGIVATSRLEMKAHDYTELTLGFLTGILPQIGLWYFWL
ncbi:hypothetical protein [Flavobacterium sp. '19STA2R22 D10 B1']|uniref:hypothetical protein n=1 Tax=Flavobacterium aerium TaxID=3037261 RepID=UPI00278BEFCD|nr:hypothetical protein [Flavobacterium sp. '19STA2R22 D10 B1']